MRTVILSFGLLVLMCSAGVYGVYSYFSRDAEMRASERRYNTKYAEQIAQAQAAHAARAKAADTDDAWGSGADSDLYSEEEELDLDNWYAASASDDGPLDTEPEDYSYLIDDTVPFE